MLPLRSALFYLGQYTLTLLYFPICLLATLLSDKSRFQIISGWAYMVTAWLKLTCGIRHTVTGVENIPDTACVLASNHQSDWETIVPQTFLPPHIWVLKKELLRIPVFGWSLALTKPIAIDRSKTRNAIEQVLNQGVDRIQGGRHVMIYPEGTRMPYGKAGKYKTGGAKLARAAGVPIVPIAHNAGKYWSRSSWIKRPGTIEYRVGKPINVEGKSDREVTEEVRQWIEQQAL